MEKQALSASLGGEATSSSIYEMGREDVHQDPNRLGRHALSAEHPREHPTGDTDVRPRFTRLRATRADSPIAAQGQAADFLVPVTEV